MAGVAPGTGSIGGTALARTLPAGTASAGAILCVVRPATVLAATVSPGAVLPATVSPGAVLPGTALAEDVAAEVMLVGAGALGGTSPGAGESSPGAGEPPGPGFACVIARRWMAGPDTAGPDTACGAPARRTRSGRRGTARIAGPST